MLLGTLIGVAALLLPPQKLQATTNNGTWNFASMGLVATAVLATLVGMVASLGDGLALSEAAELMLLLAGLGGIGLISARHDYGNGLAASALWLAAASFLWLSRVPDASDARNFISGLIFLATLGAFAVCLAVFVRERREDDWADLSNDDLTAAVTTGAARLPARPLNSALANGHGQLQPASPAHAAPLGGAPAHVTAGKAVSVLTGGAARNARSRSANAASAANAARGANAANGHALAFLVGMEGPLAGRTFCLQSGRNSVGRDARLLTGNRVLLAGDDAVSRLHATIECNGERCTVRDADSVNGLVLNGALVLDTRDLMSGDTLQIGDTVFRYEWL